MAELSEGGEVHGFFQVRRKFRRLRLLAADLGDVDVVGDDPVFGIAPAREAGKGLPESRRTGYKAVIERKLAPEEMPEHPVLPLIGQLDLDIVVDPHDPLFRVYAQRAGRAGELVAVEIRRQVVLAVLRPVDLPELPGGLEGHEAVRARGRRQHADRQCRRQLALEEAALLEQEELGIHAVIVQVPQEIEEAFLNAARAQILLEEGNAFFVHLVSAPSAIDPVFPVIALAVLQPVLRYPCPGFPHSRGL